MAVRLPAKMRMKETWRTQSLSAAGERQRQRSAQHRQRLRAAGPANLAGRIYGRPSNMEVKSFDSIPIGAAAMPTLGTCAGAEPAAGFAGITELNCIQQGATVAQRIGNKVMIKSLHLKVSMISAAAVQACVRFMIVYDRQPNGAFPAIADILTDQPAAVATPYGGLNIANKSRFQVIRDSFLTFDPAQSQVHNVNIYAKGRWESEFGTNAGNIGDFRTGSVLLVAFTTFLGGGNVQISNGSCRCRFYD